jgi:phosphatidylinositol 4-phosphatase
MNIGAYILSPLEESSRDPEENGGFVITWSTSNQESRATSYSVRNRLDAGLPFPPTPTSPSFGNRRRSSGLSNVLATSTQNFAAFKVLPIDPMRTCKEMSDQYVELSDEMQRASSCRDAVDLIVDKICNACEDVGGGQGRFVSEEDVVRFVPCCCPCPV